MALRISSSAINVSRLRLCRPSHIRIFPPLSRREFANPARKTESSALDHAQADTRVSTSVGERVKETTKTVSYAGVILGGLGVTGFVLYTMFKELFSTQSPQAIYAKALEKCIAFPRVSDLLGEPIKGFGEQNSRGRRRHVSHMEYIQDGEERMRMKFYIQGSRKRATVHLEMRKSEKGVYEYRYLFVQLKDYPRETVVVEDNRGSSHS